MVMSHGGFPGTAYVSMFYRWAKDCLFALTLWDIFLISATIWVFCYVVCPLIDWLGRQIKAVCKPIMFPYQHVVVTGGGTGLGRSLV
jgi:hypothetical protein